MAVETQGNGSIWRSEEGVEELLPGIPNDITLSEITSKLPWTAFHVLSSVSRCWRGAIQRREVYKARVHAQATETLLVHYHQHGECDAVCLYSPKDDCCYELPAVPHIVAGKRFLRRFECVTVNGKIYVIEGRIPKRREESRRPDVYMFDVAGQRQWEQCASMQERRIHFACGVIHGKIYVSGGTDSVKPVLASEVYDPEVNAWSPITPMTLGRRFHLVTTFGDELFAYGGQTCETGEFRSSPHSCEVYNAGKNEWRLFDLTGRVDIFTANGKLYSMSGNGRYVDVLDADKMSWANLHTNCYAATGLLHALAMNDELFVDAFFNFPIKECLVRTKGLDGEKRRLVWQKANASCCSRKLSHRAEPILKGLIHL